MAPDWRSVVEDLAFEFVSAVTQSELVTGSWTSFRATTNIVDHGEYLVISTKKVGQHGIPKAHRHSPYCWIPVQIF